MNARSALLLALLVASACTQTRNYPVTGRPCGPDDPVQTIRAGECLPPR